MRTARVETTKRKCDCYVRVPYAVVSKPMSFKVIAFIAAKNNLPLYHVDITMAFLNAEMKESVYIHGLSYLTFSNCARTKLVCLWSPWVDSNRHHENGIFFCGQYSTDRMDSSSWRRISMFSWESSIQSLSTSWCTSTIDRFAAHKVIKTSKNSAASGMRSEMIVPIFTESRKECDSDVSYRLGRRGPAESSTQTEYLTRNPQIDLNPLPRKQHHFSHVTKALSAISRLTWQKVTLRLVSPGLQFTCFIFAQEDSVASCLSHHAHYIVRWWVHYLCAYFLACWSSVAQLHCALLLAAVVGTVHDLASVSSCWSPQPLLYIYLAPAQLSSFARLRQSAATRSTVLPHSTVYQALDTISHTESKPLIRLLHLVIAYIGEFTSLLQAAASRSKWSSGSCSSLSVKLLESLRASHIYPHSKVTPSIQWVSSFALRGRFEDRFSLPASNSANASVFSTRTWLAWEFWSMLDQKPERNSWTQPSRVPRTCWGSTSMDIVG